ncbi:zwei Ig domain protein zig-8 [Drosophila innubila]|uniref:zwei Ig domain protein zig-8 n=1 Tax=Drosophila innubila TaxID=198719 RepID=UPI00148C4F81|nr:zwei Ig domain protein zig-8 [Drosophila innubila]
MPRNITGRTGHTEAIIKCRVDSLHDKSVSWIRKRDLHILTVGTATYTTDKRFKVSESKDAREWTLHVKSPQAKDSGIYECQVNTEPKMSMAFQLNIIEISPDAKAIISGPHDLHFKSGSAIILNCVVKQPSVKDIGPIYWYRGEHMITPFDSDVEDADNLITQGQGQGQEQEKGRGKEQTSDQLDASLNEVLNLEVAKDFTTRIAMESQLGDTLKSRLRISNAQTTDTGNYTCQPTTASSASVMVHVINDENPAAMQKSATLALIGQHTQQRLGLMCCAMLLLLLLAVQ